MDLIPAIDLIEGKVVRLAQGDYDQKTIYSSNPLEVAKAFEDHGIRRLHVVDLEGAKGGGIVNLETLETLARNTALIIDFGGGIKKEEDLRQAFDAGARYVTVGSIAVTEPALVKEWIQRFGLDRLILGADSKGGIIRTHGWLKESGLDVQSFIESYLHEGLDTVICTDIAKDGMLSGPSYELYGKLLGAMPSLKLIASGGVSSIRDLERLRDLGMDGAIIGRALYEGTITLDELARCNG
ncbi:MAG: 1-(5-phosphoribosyl)-5-((5-phosphoribosylamino)methylideneamino) imidazole-4-carboxamide isomerase [Spirochaetes bacterium ADurb.Bin315]|nr:MAG: 1-(5-phosphoribosyl)-5-((5-phosphoribosylamino)methylideneamino) imidazole-4-carboxamide isomerase [Spirochaetes bacterium ADurb.Bin315]HOE88962.1 1-(5-phosphoribosyl)-5-[(5-phosphoribosylamino)methylideneamino]imidazole-4-carboxamide isomerase [Sphaerochaeta sp.]HPK64577.1 1-(5-phosphoribosyl)-5-[(5-phosphoribosylamino)methylideneamino]imidazole-4-carboxamide isomerase [Sphaerochaeta sp.]HRV24290.1 1-(5-phosphoribosyl)-5-[(5-phosphoribosylamino)methylideneamino]imidazole-4-carboxamide i